MGLSKEQIASFKERLVRMRSDLTRHLQGATKDVKQPETSKGYSQHQADEGTDDFDRSVILELTSKEMELLRQIDHALEKIAENSYGVCDVTGKEIPLARLEAVPYASMTIEAQEKFERGL